MDPERIQDAAATVIRAAGAVAPLTAIRDRDALRAVLRVVGDYDREVLVRIAAEALAAGRPSRCAPVCRSTGPGSPHDRSGRRDPHARDSSA